MAAANLPPSGTVFSVPPGAVSAAITPWPAIVVGVAAVVGICLWLLFRSGSIADRARADDAATTDAPPEPDLSDGTEGDDQSPSGGR